MSTLRIEGEIEPDVAALFAEQLAQMTKDDAPLTLDLSEADVEDARSCAALVDAIRAAAARLGGLQLVEPPQVLAHTLYRVGALRAGGVIHVVSPREELGTSS